MNTHFKSIPLHTCKGLCNKSGIYIDHNFIDGASFLLQLTYLINVMQFLNQLYALSKRNVILRYKHSLIGFLWGFIKPLIYLLIFIVIFSAQFSSVKNYVLYATSGILFWFFFSNIVSQGVQNIIQASV